MNDVSVKSIEPPATRNQVVAVLELLATRMRWSSARSLISETSLHASRGWSETLAGVREGFYSDAIWTSAYETLGSAARRHTYVGNKRVSFFDLRQQNDDDRARIVGWARESALSDLSQSLHNRPFSVLDAPVTKDLLEPFKNLAPQIIAADFKREKLYMQFFSTRSYTHREPLDISKMSAAQQRVFEEYEELIGVKTKSVPCFDTVVIDTENELVEIRVDFQPGMTEDKNISAFSRVVEQLNRIAGKYVGNRAVTTSLMNLHPAINPMYLDDKCGCVTALGFVATGKESSSNNHGQIHRTTKDFRKDDFHMGGKSHVGRIDPYAIGVTWQKKPPRSDLYLELKGSVRTIYANKLGSVTAAEIIGCGDEADFEFVAGQVLSRLKRKKK